jgi:hypothetical protein
MLHLERTYTANLLSQPESGMGYQIVEATLADNKTKRGVAYNAELLLFDEEPRSLMQTASYSAILESAKSSAGEIKSLRVIPRPATRTLTSSVRESTGDYGKKAGPAKDAPREKTKAGEVFKRFSAYKNDNRVLADGSLRPGTYATTEEDAKNVKTGAEAVARYALPNPAPASYVFTIRPHKDTVLQRGIVEPAYGQPGGGVEVIFTDGTQPNTVTGPDKIPDK